MNDPTPTPTTPPTQPLARTPEKTQALNLAAIQQLDAGEVAAIHVRALPGIVYANVIARRVGGLANMVGGELAPTSVRFVDDLMDRMKPRDPAEEMLIGQLVMAHARVMHLTTLAATATDPDNLRTLNEYADKASNTYRRLMLALADYRKPAPAPGSTVTINAANVAGQQLIQNHDHAKPENATNELSSQPHNPAQAPKTLPAVAGWLGIPASDNRPREAVDAIHRPTDTGGQGPVADERDEAR